MPKRAKIIPFPGRRSGPAAPPPPGNRGGPPPVPREGPLVAVYRGSQSEALVVKSLFESEGIPAVVRARLTPSVYPFTVGDQGEVAVLVPESEARRSRRLLVRIVRRRSLP